MTSKRNQARYARLKLVDQLGKVVDAMTMLEDRFETASEQLQRCARELEWYHAELRKHVPSSEIERELRKHRRGK
jgi:hypothetical protein